MQFAKPEREVVTVKEIVVQAPREKHLDLPHISNLHEDPMLCGKVETTWFVLCPGWSSAEAESSRRASRPVQAVTFRMKARLAQVHYSFPLDEVCWLGKQADGWKPAVVLAGVGIQKQHCRVENRKDGVTIYVDEENQQAVASTFVNGDNFFFEAGEGCEMQHGDRIVIGQNYAFVFVDPKKGEFVQDLLDAGKVLELSRAFFGGGGVPAVPRKLVSRGEVGFVRRRHRRESSCICCAKGYARLAGRVEPPSPNGSGRERSPNSARFPTSPQRRSSRKSRATSVAAVATKTRRPR